MKNGSIKDWYTSGFVAGENAANGQGPADEPAPGRTKRDQAYYEGWQRGHADAREDAARQRSAIMRTRNSWA